MKKKLPDFILAIDPGLLTGISFFDYRDPDNVTMVWSYEATIEEYWEKIPEIIETTENLHVVVENFIITVETAKKSPAPWSLKLNGMTEFLCWLHEVPYTEQAPVEREFTSHEFLKYAEFWHKGGEGHANQASRHAVVYMIKSLKNKSLARKIIEQ